MAIFTTCSFVQVVQAVTSFGVLADQSGGNGQFISEERWSEVKENVVGLNAQ